MLLSYNLALVTTLPENPTKVWNFFAMVTAFSCSSCARTFSSKGVAVNASASFNFTFRLATCVFSSVFSLSRQSIRAQRSSISRALGSALMCSSICLGSTPNSSLIASSTSSIPRYCLFACQRLTATMAKGLGTHSDSSSSSGCAGSVWIFGGGGGRCSS